MTTLNLGRFVTGSLSETSSVKLSTGSAALFMRGRE
ncbi:hypothetical protein EVA_07926 [gut metagenome]|uniref:Uncharacterized protein n=1 Tax=gut metagenome TaxID=749906 RepID=J9CUQ7_9ZZZZ